MAISCPVLGKEKISSKVPADLAVDGQVFIVTQGQQAIRLALVPIALLSDDQIHQLISARTASMNKRRSEIAVELHDLVNARSTYNIQLEEKRVELRAVGSKITECAIRLSPSQPNYAVDFASCSQAPEMIAARRRAESLFQELNGVQAREGSSAIDVKIDDLLVQYDAGTSINDGYNFLAQAASAQVKSDIDGKFQLKVSGRGRFALLAQSSRHVAATNQETYRWFIWLPTVKAGERISVMLANDNLILASGCKECVDFNDDHFLIRHPEVKVLFEEKRNRARLRNLSPR